MTATLYGPKPACSTNTLPTWHNATEWDTLEPSCYGEWRKFTAPARELPDLKRRSESKYSPDMTEAGARAQVGQTIGFEGWVLPKLGAAGTELRHWHYLAQLIGANYDGQYAGGAAVALAVREGSWQLEFGATAGRVPLYLAPYVDNASVFVKLDVTLSELATVGRVVGTVAGVAVDVNVRTFWHQSLVWSHGLYRGSGNTPAPAGPQPTYEQTVFWKLLAMPKTWPTP